MGYAQWRHLQPRMAMGPWAASGSPRFYINVIRTVANCLALLTSVTLGLMGRRLHMLALSPLADPYSSSHQADMSRQLTGVDFWLAFCLILTFDIYQPPTRCSGQLAGSSENRTKSHYNLTTTMARMKQVRSREVNCMKHAIKVVNRMFGSHGQEWT